MPTSRASARRREASDDLFVLGLVGRTGSGKTTVAQALAAEGAVVIDADRLGHDVTDHDPEVRAALIQEYGPEAYTPEGALDRARVAARVFRDAEARARLDRMVHPRIAARILARLAALGAEGFDGVVVIDAALLLEWGLERACDAVIAVEAREEDQVARQAAARGWTPDEARRRLAAQRDAASFRAAADMTIENTGTPEALVARARAAVAELRAQAR